MVDAQVSKTCESNLMRVRLSLPALLIKTPLGVFIIIDWKLANDLDRMRESKS